MKGWERERVGVTFSLALLVPFLLLLCLCCGHADEVIHINCFRNVLVFIEVDGLNFVDLLLVRDLELVVLDIVVLYFLLLFKLGKCAAAVDVELQVVLHPAALPVLQLLRVYLLSEIIQLSQNVLFVLLILLLLQELHFALLQAG